MLKRQRHVVTESLRNKIIRTNVVIGEGGRKVSETSYTYNPGYMSVDGYNDDTIVWDGNGRSHWHECSHDTVSEKAQQPSWEWMYSDEYFRENYNFPPGYTYNYGLAGEVCLQVAPNFTYDVGFYVPSEVDSKLDDLKSAGLQNQLDWGTAWESVMDDAAGLMPSDTSVGVNIAEFAQLKRLVPGLAKSVRRILNYVRGQPNKTVRRYRYLFDKKTGKRIPWTATIETVKLRSLSWSLRDLASLNLGFNFGVLPLADDVGNWAAKLYQVQQHLNWLNSRASTFWARARTNTVEMSTGTTRRTSRIGVGDMTVESGYHAAVTGNLHVQCRASLKTGSAKYNALLSQVLGLNVPMQVAWDLVPFSFVVDWFLPVGKLISRIEPRRALGSLTRDLSVLQTWYSIQGEYKFESKVVKYTPEEVLDGRLIDGGVMSKTITSYSRLRGTPAYNLIPAGKVRYGGKQFLLSLSLLAQRFTGKR